MAMDTDPRPAAAEPPAPMPPPHPLSGITTWLPWVLLAAAVTLGLALLDRGQPRSVASAPTPVQPAVANRRAPAADAMGIRPRLRIDVSHGRANVNGQLAEADRARLEGALAKLFGPEGVHGDIAGDATTPAADWLDGLIALLPELKARTARVAIDGDRVKADLSAVPAGPRTPLSGKVRAAFPGLGIDGLEPSATAPADAGDGSRQAAPRR